MESQRTIPLRGRYILIRERTKQYALSSKGVDDGWLKWQSYVLLTETDNTISVYTSPNSIRTFYKDVRVEV